MGCSSSAQLSHSKFSDYVGVMNHQQAEQMPASPSNLGETQEVMNIYNRSMSRVMDRRLWIVANLINRPSLILNRWRRYPRE